MQVRREDEKETEGEINGKRKRRGQEKDKVSELKQNPAQQPSSVGKLLTRKGFTSLKFS